MTDNGLSNNCVGMAQTDSLKNLEIEKKSDMISTEWVDQFSSGILITEAIYTKDGHECCTGE